MKKIKQKQSGFTLIEIIVSLFVLTVLMISVFTLIKLSLQMTDNNAKYVEAIEIANQKMEYIRNLPYDDVGVVSGIPSGIIPAVETISRGGNFTINNYIVYYDDDFDGLIGSSTPDTIPNDYKIVTVKVSWQSKAGEKHVSVFSKIVPRTMETFAGYGLLKIYVGDASAQPVANANVRVVNNLVSPAIDVTNLTDSKGLLYLPATSSAQGYEITVTKTDEEPAVYYGTDRTYDPSTSKSPFHLSVTAGNMTEESFTIDKLAHLNIRTVSTDLPNNWQVNETLSGRDESGVKFALDNSDNMYFAWQSYDGGSSYVYAQKYDSAGTKQWTNDHKISATAYQANPDIAVTASGNSFVVWQDNSKNLKAITRACPAIRLAKKFIPRITNIQPGLEINEFDLWPDFSSPLYLPGKAGSRLNFKPAGMFGKITDKALKSLGDSFKINSAQAAGSIVQTKISPIENSANTLTTSFDSQPAAGDVIIAVAMHRNNWASFSAPYNSAGTFTEAVYSNSNWYLDVGIWYKVAGASEPSQVWIDNSGDIDGGVLMLLEVSGLDTSDLLDVTVKNDQTGWNSTTATTNLTAQSEASGFAVAAIGWGDNDFNTPTSANWSSGSSDTWTQTLWKDWSFGYDGSLALATMDISAADNQRATLTLTGGGSEQRNSALAVFKVLVPDNITVSATGTMISSTTVSSVNQYLGGAFVLTDNTGSHNITDITITEYGSVDAQNDLDNIKLYYDLDTSAPYDCASESYSGSEAQFGSTDSDGFSSADGVSSFSGLAGISTTQTMCVYVVLDVGGGDLGGENIKIKINDPSSEVAIDSGTVLPATAVSLDGAVNINTPAEMRQIHYRWRNDDGSEIGASWAESEDTPLATQDKIVRLRFVITNGGTLLSDPIAYRLEYGEKTTTCAAIASWTALPYSEAADWRMIDSTNITNSEPTTNNSGLTDENLIFKAGEAKDTDNQTGGISLSGAEFTEIEYALKPTGNVSDSQYCFRLTDAGASSDFNYLVYPEISVVGDNNIYIVSLDSNGNELWAVKRVNTDIANEEQTNPQIAVTENFGQATSTIVWEDERNGDKDIYAQIMDMDGNKILGSDLRITSSSTDEHSPSIAFDANDNFFVAWVDNSSTTQKIYLQKYNLTDQSHWTASKNIVNSPFDVYDPKIKIDASSNLYLTYTEDTAGIKNSYLAKYDNNGNFLWEKQVNQEEAAYDQENPGLAVNNSYVYAAWTDNRNGNGDIYAEKYDLSGAVQWTEDLRLNINLGTSTQAEPVLAINTAGTPFAAWTDGRNGEDDIFATEFKDPGAITGKANVPIFVYGTKTISETPVIEEYRQDLYTDASGYADLSVENDTGYYVDLVSASTTLNIVLRDPPEPLGILPDETKTWLIYVEP